jgi:hypothetical protein
MLSLGQGLQLREGLQRLGSPTRHRVGVADLRFQDLAASQTDRGVELGDGLVVQALFHQSHPDRPVNLGKMHVQLQRLAGFGDGLIMAASEVENQGQVVVDLDVDRRQLPSSLDLP